MDVAVEKAVAYNGIARLQISAAAAVRMVADKCAIDAITSIHVNSTAEFCGIALAGRTVSTDYAVADDGTSRDISAGSVFIRCVILERAVAAERLVRQIGTGTVFR